MPTHKITNIHRSHRYPGCIYACLIEIATGEVVISATIDYILDAIKERGYIVEGVGNV